MLIEFYLFLPDFMGDPHTHKQGKGGVGVGVGGEREGGRVAAGAVGAATLAALSRFWASQSVASGRDSRTSAQCRVPHSCWVFAYRVFVSSSGFHQCASYSFPVRCP